MNTGHHPRLLTLFASMFFAGATIAAMVPPVAVARTNSITIDGDIADFNKRSPVFIDRKELLALEAQISRSWRGTNDLSATVYFNYDDEYLYIGCQVFDETRTHKSRTGNYFNGDGVEVFLSGDFIRNGKNAASGPNDFQFYFLPPTSPGETLFVYKAKGGEKTSTVLSLYGIVAASKEFGDRYTMEIRVPLHLFGTGNTSRGIGINIAIDDADGTAYRETQIVMNGSPNAYMAPKYLEMLRLSGSYHNPVGAKPPLGLIAVVIAALAVFTGYAIALRFIIVLPLTIKLWIAVGSACALLLCAGVYGIAGFAVNAGRNSAAARIAAIDESAMSNIARAFAGRMDFDEFSERLYAYAIGSNVDSTVRYDSLPLIPAVKIIKSRQGTPMRLESSMILNWSFTNGIVPVRARGVRMIISGYDAYAKITNKGEAYRISFHSAGGRRFEHILTNGVTLFSAEYRHHTRTNTIASVRYGIGLLNRNTMAVTGIADEYELLFPEPALINAISFDQLMAGVSIAVRAITFIGASGDYIVGPFITSREWYSWQGTRISRYVSIFDSFEGYSDALLSVDYPFSGYADEFRVQYNGYIDSASRDIIPFGAIVAAVDIIYSDGTVVRTPIIDGLSYSITSELFGHGHPPHFTSKVSRRSISPNGFMGHDKELVVPARPGKKIGTVRFVSLLPATRLTPYGMTGIRKSSDQIDCAPLSHAERKHISAAETLVYYNGTVLPRNAAPQALSAVNGYFDEHPPYRQQDFGTARIVHTDKGTLIVTPLRYGNDMSPLALVHFLPHRESAVAFIMKIIIVLAGFFTFVSALLLITHIVIDARILSMKMLAISISLAVVPLAAATVLFIYIYNRNAVNDVLAGRSALSESFIHSEIAGTLSSLADISKRACDTVLAGGELSTGGPVYLQLHDVDRDRRTLVLRYSSNTPARFMRAESARQLKRSGPILNSVFGPVLAWTTIRTEGGRIVSVTAFREIDAAMLAFWGERTKSEASIHFLNGYRYSSAMAVPYHIRVNRSKGGGALPESSERIIGGRQYYLHAFPVKNQLQEEQMLIGTAIDAASFAETRLIIIAGGIAFALIAGALAFAIAWWFSQRISGAVLTVAGGMKRVEAGDLSVSVTVDSRDEIASLADGFNTMAKTLANLRT
ncbi:MAG: sugar-binding protein, partial [Spirochaetota bacterium]